MPTVNLGNLGNLGSLGSAQEERRVVVPGRVRLEVAELVALAQAGPFRLPFDVSAVEAALTATAEGSGSAADEARRAWYARLSPDAASPQDEVALLLAAQAGRVRESSTDADRAAARAAMTEAIGVLADAEALLEVELGLRLGPDAPAQARAWVGVRGETAVSLATVSGAEFELAWGATAALPEMLAHLVRLPADPDDPDDPDDPEEADLPDRFTIPVELLAAVEAGAARHRDELLPALVERFPGAVTGADDTPYDAGEALTLLHTVHDRMTARLRVVVAGRRPDVAGVVVWLRVAGQWYAVDPDTVAGFPVARARAAVPRDLARSVGPVLARVWGRDV
ncbi:hypothetical protein GCM10022237_15850 [Nocardioides ginsengisoli]|uniref:Uncharacterized protein n=1 Tax=Nocardioides ginsengisoli TaxID=363868 RepID=A0ABW3W321_9ACTN